jgi:hypothetical protein
MLFKIKKNKKKEEEATLVHDHFCFFTLTLFFLLFLGGVRG